MSIESGKYWDPRYEAYFSNNVDDMRTWIDADKKVNSIIKKIKKSAYQKKYREENREKLALKRAARGKINYEKNKVKISEYKKQYYKKKKSEISAVKKEYYENNKPKIYERGRKFYLKNRERLLLEAKKYRQRKKLEKL
ncbi:MAG: hypothetical protein E3J43_08555, partial [Candidatus Heimdallarchaeota archaeon]